MKALVTGASGFVGSHLAEALIAQGWQVRVLLRTTSSRRWVPSQAEVVLGDVTVAESLLAAVTGMDVVFHAGGLTTAVDSDQYFAVNANGTAHLLAACAALSQPPHVLLLSSLAAAGPSDWGSPHYSGSENSPVSNYGRSKLAAEKNAQHYQQQIPLTILRPPAVYGPRERDIFQYFQFAQRGILAYPRRESCLSFIYVSDLVAALLLCAQQSVAYGKTYYISDGSVYRFHDIIDTLETITQKRIVRIPIPLWIVAAAAVGSDIWYRKIRKKAHIFSLDKYAELKYPCWTVSNQKIQQDLPFQPHYDLNRGFQETYQWYLREKWL